MSILAKLFLGKLSVRKLSLVSCLLIGAVANSVLVTHLGAAELGDDGMHKQDWFSLTFKDIAEDISESTAEGKRLVVIFEQRGCIYCTKMHEELLSDPQVSEYIKENFNVVQMNLFGDEEVTDTDGEVLSEKKTARKWSVVFTPTLLFMPETTEGLKGSAAELAVVKMPGAFGKGTFLDMFRWVKQNGYESDEHFQQFHARSIKERKAANQ